MPDRPQGRDRRAGAKQIIGQKRHLVVRAQVFDHLRAGDFGALKVPGAVLVLVAVARMEIEDLVREVALGLRADGHQPGRGERKPRLERLKCQTPPPLTTHASMERFHRHQFDSNGRPQKQPKISLHLKEIQHPLHHFRPVRLRS